MLSAHQDGASIITNGNYAGKSFREYLAAEGLNVCGTNYHTKNFPVLTKFIDAQDNLSVQVHPSDDYAQKFENQLGKSEFWYILDSAPDAFIYRGLNRVVTKSEFVERVNSATLEEILQKVPAHKGDCFFIPAGTIHSVGKGILLAEIQQNSNVSYRIYDYNRRGADGKMRELHLDKALDVANLKPFVDAKNYYPHIVTCDYFTVDKINLDGKFTSRLEGKVTAESVGLGGNLLRSYFIYKLAHEPNLISTTIERTGGKVGESLHDAFSHDVKILFDAAENFDSPFDFMKNYKSTIKNKSESFNELEKNLEDLRVVDEIVDVFINHYKKFGCGDIADYRAFRFDESTKNLVGIKHFEKIKLDDLIGYAHQKELLTQNTNAFIERKPANNVLLVGARGTGKSSSVKALVNENYLRGLRLVQLTKPQLKFLPEVMETLRNFAGKRFIIFLDDLSFEESEAEYKYLKSSIEGGVESLPQNVLIYATSNRRHLIRENNFDDRYNDDNLNETISLSDRFGLIVHYYPPSQNEYLEIISHMLRKNNIELDAETLRIEGLRWEMSHSGRNGRTAQQFVKNFLGTKD